MVLAVLFSGLVAILFVVWNDSAQHTATRKSRGDLRAAKGRLLAELERLQRRFAQIKSGIGGSDTAHLTTTDFSFVTDDVRSLGILTAREATAVMRAYATYIEQVSRLAGERDGVNEGSEATSFLYDLRHEGNRQRAETALDRIIAALDAALATLRAVPLARADDAYPHVTAWLSPRHKQV